jgi:hypothetical protein
MSYNGWTNYNTWNVALWIGADEGFYQIARTCRVAPRSYAAFVDCMSDLGIRHTADEVRWDDATLDVDALDACIRDL